MTDLRALYGTDEPPREGRRLSCGAAEVTLEDGQLRHLRIDGHEAVRSIAFLVRDRDWGTVPPRIGDLRIEEAEQSMRVTYRAAFDMGGRLVADVTLLLTASGCDATVSALAEGEVWTNRAGFTVLHPINGVAGAPVRVDHADGSRTDSRFPDLIAPWQPFMNICALTHQAGPWRVACRFDGDVFEMEDQRQWGDASFKTYNRPLALPWPYVLAEGSRLEQSVSIRWQHRPAVAAQPSPAASVDKARFPQTALLMTAPEAARAAANPDPLQTIGPQRLLCHLDAAGDIQADLAAFAALQARVPEVAFDVELIAACPPDVDPALEFMAHAEAMRASGLQAASVMITPAVDRRSTPPGSDWPPCPPLADILSAARRAFPEMPLGGGVAAFFPELNRKRPPVEMLDFVTHGFCPIVHAADDISVMETLETVPHILASGRTIAGGIAYRLGPSTIAMRQNPYGSRTIPNPDRLRTPMAADDPRQDGTFAAAWTCGLATALAPAELAVWTPGSLYGPRGLVRDNGTARPVAALVTALARRAGGGVGLAELRNGLAVLELDGDVIVANLSPQPVTLPGGYRLDGFGWRLGAKELLPAAKAPRA